MILLLSLYYIGVHYLRAKKPPVEIRQVGITYDPNLPCLRYPNTLYHIWRYPSILQHPPHNRNGSGVDIVTGVLKQSVSPLCQCQGSRNIEM
jgi:hypothetical protein